MAHGLVGLFDRAIHQRSWIQIAAGPDCPEEHGLTVVSYNILANKYATSGYHAYCPEPYLAWSYRQPKLLEELLRLDPDIICLQEVEGPSFQADYQSLRDKGYQGLYCPRRTKPEDTIQGPPDGCALFYRTPRLSLVTHELCRFADHVPADKTGAFWDLVRSREDGAVLAVLRDAETDTTFLATSLHLFFDPNFPDVKLAQAAIACKRVQELLQRSGHVGAPVVMAGDYNSLWRKYQTDIFDTVPEAGYVTSGVYQLLATGILEPGHHDHPGMRRRGHVCTGEQHQLDQEVFTTSGLALASMHMALPEQQEPPLTTKTSRFAGCLDYFFLSQPQPQIHNATQSSNPPSSATQSQTQTQSPAQCEGHWRVRSVLGMPYPGAVHEAAAAVGPLEVEFPAIPNAEFASDHLLMACKVSLVHKD